MKTHRMFSIWLAAGLLTCSSPVLFAGSLPGADNLHRVASDFGVGKGTFLLDGKPFVVKAAELHYPRIPKEYWEHRIKMSKALGMNTICLYVFWNVHELNPEEFNFDGQNNLREFIKLCEANDMKVILRPGPYVCAEWEMGGLPWWLLRDDDIELRKSDPRFLAAVERFEKRLKQELEGLTAPEGGPIIMIQVENEYGSYGEDKEYVGHIADMLRKLYPDVTLFQCDWSTNFTLNGLPDLLWTMNFGTGANIDGQFAELRSLRPDTPLMCSEFWSGWFDKWGASHETRQAQAMTEGIDEMLSKGISFSLYMTHGGTNWGHWAGANSPGFAPDVTSYDYDAPIDEQGRPTDKYFMLRKVLERYNDREPLPPLPDPIPVSRLDRMNLQLVAGLDSLWNGSFTSQFPESMEKYGQGYGMIKYATVLPKGCAAGDRLMFEPRDYVQVFANGEHIGTLDRRLGRKELTMPELPPDTELTLVVEAMGRINFGTAIKDPKGMVGKVELKNGRGEVFVPQGWSVSLMPDNFAPGYKLYDIARMAPVIPVMTASDRLGVERMPAGLYRAGFRVKESGDTYLDMSGWGKGQVWVNGHALGRFWEIGPQQSLYLPGVWLRDGTNEIVVLDIIGPRNPVIAGLEEPIVDMLQDFGEEYRQGEIAPDVSNLKPMVTGKLQAGNGWKLLKGKKPVVGNRLILEIGRGRDGAEAALAEIYLLGSDGKRLSRELWSVAFTQSADVKHNRGADKLFDLQESTYWESANSDKNLIVIDLGDNVSVSGIELLPRAESGAPGLPSDIKVYIE